MRELGFEEAETVIMTNDMVRRMRQQVLIEQREARSRALRRRRVRLVVLLAVLLGAVGAGLI